MATQASEHPHAASTSARAPGRAATLLRHPWVIEGAWTVLAMAIGLLIATLTLHLWDARLHTPFNASGDGVLNYVGVRALVDHPWFLSNHQLGAPLGQELYDYSAFDADGLQLLAIKIMSLGSSDPVLLVNAWFVLGFALVSGATFLATRALGFSRAVALFAGAVFTALPYHYVRGVGHLFLGDYFAVPASGWLILTVLMGRPLLVPVEGATGVRRWLSWRTGAVALVCLVAGGSTLYYAVFTILLTGICAILRAITVRSWRAGVPGILACVAIGIVLVVSISPGLVYTHQHGKDTPVAQRFAFESEMYSTSLTQFVLPIADHRVGAFAKLTARHTATTPISGELGEHAGLLCALSLIGLLIFAGVRLLRGPPAVQTERAALVGATTVAALLSFLWATFGGFSALFAYVVSPQIRAWSRLTPFLCFFALVGALCVAELVRARLLRNGTRGRIGLAAVLTLVGVVAILDQTTKRSVFDYKGQATAWADNQHFVSAIDRSVPRSSMILELPFHEFPETGPVNGMQDYDEFNGYLHSKDLRWSFGAMKGRPEDWGAVAATRPLPWVLKAATAAGFAGVYIDRAAYTDHGAAVEATVRRTLGNPAPIGDDSGRLVFYSALALRAQQQQTMSAAQRQALSDALIHPIDVDYDGFYGEEPDPANGVFRWMSQSGTLDIHNDRKAARPVVFSATARAGVGSMTIAVPGQPVRTVKFTSGPQRIRVRFTAAPGETKISLHAETPEQGEIGTETRDLRVQLYAPSVLPVTGGAG